MTPRWWETCLALVVLAALQLALVFNPAIVEVDSEELWNATQAWQMLECHFTDAFLLQYREFCGGCSLDAMLGMAVFSVLGRSWLAWKVVPLLFVLLLAALGSRTLHRIAGRPAALAFLALLLLPPRTWLFLSSVAWGNHYEAGCLALCGLCLLSAEAGRARTLLGGLMLGLATWVSFSGAFAIPAALIWVLLCGPRAQIGHLIAGIILGLMPWALQWLSSGLHPFVTIYQGSEALPSLSRVPYKLGTLLRPRQLVALFGLPGTTLGWWLGWLWASAALGALAVLGQTARREQRGATVRHAALGLLLFLGSWLSVYCLVRFQVHDPVAPEIAFPLSMRYAAPLFPLLFFAIALAVGCLWRAQRRGLAMGLLSLALLCGVAARAESLSAPFPAAGLHLFEAADWEFLRPGFGTRLSLDALERCASDELRTGQLHAYALGREHAAAVLRAQASIDGLIPPIGEHQLHWWQGVGEATARHCDDPSLYGSGQVEPLTQLRMTEAMLQQLEPQQRNGQQAALRAAASGHYAGTLDWLKIQGGWDREAMPALAGELRKVHATVALAGWWAQGLDCGRALAAFHQPTEIVLPLGLEKVPPTFFEGVGTALGERWGPLRRPPRPRGLPRYAGRAFEEGYEAGVARRWLINTGLSSNSPVP